MELPVTIKEVGNREGLHEWKTKIQKDGTFEFNLVKPGRWDVTIEPGQFCYKHTSQRITLGNKKSVTDIQFTMTGRQIPYTSSHTFTALAKPLDTSSRPI